VLAGLAGAGKTERLEALAAAGEQVLDLEALAGHRGSAFGGLGRPPQPAQAAFDAAVAATLASVDPQRTLWTEDEAPFLGSLALPLALQAAIARAPVVAVDAPAKARIDRLVREYGDCDRDDLLAALGRTRRRLGAARADAAAAAVRAGRLRDAVAAVLPYFDAAYRHRMAGLPRPLMGRLA